LKFGRTNSNKRNLGLGRTNDEEGDLELDRKKKANKKTWNRAEPVVMKATWD